jgi:hypothetical protein
MPDGHRAKFATPWGGVRSWGRWVYTHKRNQIAAYTRKESAMRVRKRTIAVLIAVASAIWGAPITATAAPIKPLWIPGLAKSEAISGPVLAKGQLFGKNGQPASGTVYAVVWPIQAVLAAQEDGDKVKTMAIAQGAAKSNGHFQLRVDPKLRLDSYTEADGTLNLDIRAGGADGLALWAVSRRLVDRGTSNERWVEPRGGKGHDREPPGLKLALGQAGSMALDGDAAVPAPAADKGPCDEVVATYQNVTTGIGETYPGPHAKATFIYTNGQTSSLGVAVSADGTFGSFSQGGTSTSAGATTLSFPQKTYNTKFIYQTTFQYKKYHVYDALFCVFDYGYEVRTTAFQGAVMGYNACCAPTTPYSQPVNVVPAHIIKDTSNAVNWSDGVKLSAVIGINLSSMTGYSNSAKVDFYFTAVGSLRGNHPDGYVYSARVRGY